MVVALAGLVLAFAGAMAILGWLIVAFIGDFLTSRGGDDFSDESRALIIQAGLALPLLVVVSAGMLAWPGPSGRGLAMAVAIFGQILNAISALVLIVLGTAAVFANLTELGDRDEKSGFVGEMLVYACWPLLGLLTIGLAVAGLMMASKATSPSRAAPGPAGAPEDVRSGTAF